MDRERGGEGETWNSGQFDLSEHKFNKTWTDSSA